MTNKIGYITNLIGHYIRLWIIYVLSRAHCFVSAFVSIT